ncbi:MAG: hypothetical protein Q9173_007308, partial [Seirophora scorigena]
MSSSSTQPLHLIIRFAIPFLDLPLTIPSPTTTTPLQLLHQHIRPNLPASYRSCPIRLIASGALLPPSAPLSTSLRLSPKTQSDPKGKSKVSYPEPSAPIYIHCSVSTTQTLSSAALAAEASASAPAPASTLPAPPPTPQDAPPSPAAAAAAAAAEPPHGFDRLLAAGLSPAEIASLRSQFLALTAHNHTPDTMPSPAAMRRLEERWLDSSASPVRDAGGGGGAGAGEMDNHGDDDGVDDGRGALEDMLWGNLLGFFWPVGAAVWLMREEGVW